MTALKFLVVDDASFVRDLMKKQLRSGFPGATVVDVPSAARAQAALRTQRFDMVLCDWEMPEMTGEEFLRWFRAHPEYADVPFIMVTSRGERDYVVKAAQAGVSDYLGKPFKAEALIAKVSRHLGDKARQAAAPTGSGATQGIAGASIAVLTGASTKAEPAEPAPRAKRGQARLHFSQSASPCAIRDISLQEMSGVIPRPDNLPTLFDPVVVSLMAEDGDVARLNAYLHSMAATERRQDAQTLRVVVRFVDDDPAKLEALSHFIADQR